MQAGLSGALSGGIGVFADPHPPSNANPGKPENFSGTIAILNNDIDMWTRPPATRTLMAGSVAAVPIDIERNAVVTGATLGSAANPDAIRVVGPESYLVAHNTIDCGWTDGGATGINVIGQAAPRTSANAVILDNDINMSAPDGTIFGPNSAGIQVRGYARGSSVLNNRINGRAGAALSVLDQAAGIPGNTTFVSNHVSGFESSLADVFVDVGATNSIVIGNQTGVQDHGSGTTVIPMR